MPIAEVDRFAREFDWIAEPGVGGRAQTFWSGTSEAAALVAAMAGRTPSDVGAVIQALLDGLQNVSLGRQRLAAAELLSAISAYPDDVIVTVTMGLSAAMPDLLTIFVRATKAIVPDILAGRLYSDKSHLANTYADLLKAAGTNLPAPDFCDLYLDLRERMLSDAADFLLKGAATNPATPEIIRRMKSHGCRREARQLDMATRQQKG